MHVVKILLTSKFALWQIFRRDDIVSIANRLYKTLEGEKAIK